MDIVSSVLGRVAQCLIDAALQELGYLLHYRHNIRTLRKQAEQLANAREKVQGKIDTAKRKGEIIETDVQKWIAEVDNTTAKAGKFFDDEVKANKRCLKGYCINLSSLYRFSKEALQKAKDISQILDEGKFDIVSHPAPPPGIISSSKVVSGAFESRNLIMKQIMETLNDDNVNIIGICGMGGVGKTTMVNEIGKQETKRKLYDAVGMAVVSQTPSVMRIQGEIASMLGLTLSGNDENERSRARLLWERMKETKRILVILDDVWGRIDLEMIGIPVGNEHRGCKILLTSRSKDVCNVMDAQRIFTVDTLSIEESWILFREVAGEHVDNSDLNHIARKVAAKCGGLPIAILTVGRALKNKEKKVWMDALRQLEKSDPTNIKGMQQVVFSTLELSYNYLESEEAKLFFLLCCLFPEDYQISFELLVKYAFGLYLFKDVDTVAEARCRAHHVVSTLSSSFLLIVGYFETWIGKHDQEKYVKMHDVVRDVALKIASKDEHRFLVKTGMGLRDWPNKDIFKDLKAISLMSNDIHELPDRLECPELQALLLRQNSHLFLAESFFEGVEDLKVLDLSENQILSLPRSFVHVTNLRTLCLVGCQLGNLSLIGKLTNLEILSLAGSNIEEIPMDFDQLAHLRLFDLTMCEHLKHISHGVITRLQKLEEFYIGFSLIYSESGRDLRTKAVLLELKVLTQLTTLDISIPTVSVLPDDMPIPFQSLTSFSISIAIEPRLHFNDYLHSRTLSLSHDLSIPLPNCLKHLLKRTEQLSLRDVKGLKNILPDLENNGFAELKVMLLANCREIVYLINTLDWTADGALRDLEELRIHEMIGLVEICHGPLPAQSLSKVKTLSVHGCGKMLHILPSHLLQRLENLRSFSATSCSSVVYAFDLEGLDISQEETKLLSLLENLEFYGLRRMTHIWNGDTRVISLCNLKKLKILGGCMIREVFPLPLQQNLNSLESLNISDCDNLEEIFEKQECEDEEIVVWKKHHTISLGKLTDIDISSCSKLKYLFTPSIVRSLEQLKRLTAGSCSSMQEIVTDMKEEKRESTDRIVFPSLDEMSFTVLKNLTCFYPRLCPIEFPVLEILTIDMCPKMKTFGYGELVTPKLNKVRTGYADGTERELWIRDLNTTVQQLYNETHQAMESEQRPGDPGAAAET